jgi:RND superfamily putative drug exporter
MQLSTAGLARSSASRPWRVVLLWVGLIVAAFGLIGGAGLNLSTDIEFLNNPDSKQGDQILADKFNLDDPPAETVIVTSENLTVDDPAFQAVVTQVMDTLNAHPDLIETGQLTNYYQLTAEGNTAVANQLVSADRHTTLVPVTYNVEDTEDGEPVVHAIDAISVDGFDVLSVGDVSIDETFNSTAEEDLQQAEFLGIPAALIILIIVFGALVAAGVPIILSIISIMVSLGITAAISQFTDLSFFITNMISMIGLAVGIDYALFIVERYRQERANGYDKIGAIEVAGATASKAVLFSGITVVLALAGLFMMPTSIFRSLGLGAMLVVIVAVLAMLTLIPAVLSLLGDRIDWPRRRNYALLSKNKPATDELGLSKGFWARITHVVMDHPVASVVLSVTFLVLCAVPFSNLNTGFAGAATLPPSDPRTAYEILARDFSVGRLSPVEIVIDAPRSPELDAEIATFQTDLNNSGLYVNDSFNVAWNEASDAAHITVNMNLDGNSPAAQDEIDRLRDTVVPSAFGSNQDDVFITGDTAINTDFINMVDEWTPIVFAFVLGLSFLLLMVAFRSIVVPISAIILNLLSVGAAYGLMVLVFQDGYLHNLLGFQKTPTIEAWIPIFLFCVLFGLSMDYHVFLLSRIREHYDLTKRNRESVAVGLQSTARIITGAALIMVAVFIGFSSGNLVMLQQMGFGLAVAVFIDATIVRTILVPSIMAILGDRNWYLPRWLNWLPNVSIEGHPPAVQQKVPEGAVAD